MDTGDVLFADRDLDFVARHEDIVGYSFVQTKADIGVLQGEPAPQRDGCTPMGIVAKIETRGSRFRRPRRRGTIPPMRGALVAALLAGCQAATGRVEVPEPMVFDLVRGLGAHRGELEANTLAVLPLESGDPAAPAAAPEVEYAVIDDLAFELELPIEDGGLFSVKLAGQYTLGAQPQRGFIHGTQVIVERLVEADAWDLTALYVPAFRFDRRWSSVFMLGLGSLVGPDVDNDVGLVANGTLFCEVDRTWTVGLEIDTLLFADAGSSMLFMPQAHWRAGERFTLQLGVGLLYLDGRIAAGTELLVPAAEGWYPQFAFRAVFEF